jgi:hypothetical protein
LRPPVAVLAFLLLALTGYFIAPHGQGP